MAENDDEGVELPPIEPRPMIVRVLAALAIVAIVVGSMWVIIRAAHNINKKVRHDLTTTIAPSTTTTIAQ
ncbi:MAG TPA: hypothetical protein VGO03_12605 [Acidimicrobiia bacterium]|jgi:hypothetical protein